MTPKGKQAVENNDRHHNTKKSTKTQTEIKLEMKILKSQT